MILLKQKDSYISNNIYLSSTFKKINMVKELKILFILLFLLGIQHAYASEEVRPVPSAKCEHLNSTNEQHNSYFYDHKLCCMCPAGYHLAGHCGDSPTSTVCLECHYNMTDPYDRYQITYGPHVLEKCEWQPPVFCNEDEIYVEGSTSIEPKCEPKLKKLEITTEVPSTVSSKSTTFAQYTTHEDDLDNEENDADLLTVLPDKGLNDAKTNDSMLQVSTDIHKFKTTPHPLVSTTPLVNETTAKHGRKIASDGSWSRIASLFVAVVCVVGLIFWLRWKKMKKSTNQETKNALLDLESGPNDQRTESLLNEENSDCSNSTVHFIPDSNELLGAGPSEINTETGNTVQEIESPPQEANERIDWSDGEDLEVGEEAHQPLIRPENNPNTNDLIPNMQRTKNKNEELITKIADITPDCVSRNQVRPIFRCVCEGNHETFLNDMDKKYYDDTPEFVAQLIKRCKEIIGRKFTPEYILQKLENMAENRKPRLLMEEIKLIIDAETK